VGHEEQQQDADPHEDATDRAQHTTS
ncbi:MAG: hypothetical protein JWO68_3730, partial [Actinomycetia bacterium]|nr:hypothetical protein [Actinomycetes bacterium]